MLKKRIIPCLDIKDGRTVKGINFIGLRNAGDPVELAKKYEKDGADELVFLDISATVENRKTLVSLVEKIACEISIPFTVGGGISSVEDAQAIIKAGADKLSLNTAVVQSPRLISAIANRLGSQCVVVAIDSKSSNGKEEVYVNGGRKKTGLATVEWAKTIEKMGAGELLVTSIDADGTKAGFAIELYQKITKAVHIPVIASGGMGSVEDVKAVFQCTQVTGALAASVFHFNQIQIPALKNELRTAKISMR